MLFRSEERATDEVFIDLVEYLRRELAEVLLEIIPDKRFKITFVDEAFVSRDIPVGAAVYTVQHVVVVHIDAAHGQVGECHPEVVLQGRHTEIEKADGIEILVKELLLVEFAGEVPKV